MINTPKEQMLWVTLCEEGGTPKQIITSDKMRSKYFLYSVNDDGSVVKIETSTAPIFKKSIC